MALWTRVTGAIVGFAVGQAAADATRPTFELIRQESWFGNPNRVISPQTLALLVAHGVADFGSAAAHAQREGYDATSFRAMVEGALEPPPLGSALEAFRRDLITEAQYRHALTKSGIETQFHNALVTMRAALPSPSELILMAVREVFDPTARSQLQLDAEYPDALTEQGQRLGYTESTMRNIWAAHWQLPSYTQGVEMLFRGEITEGEFNGLLKALDYAPTWRGPLQTIARRIPPLSDMIRFAVRDVYSPATVNLFGLGDDFPDVFATQAALHGMSREYAEQYWKAHWRLPSAIQGYRMLWRDIITPPQLDGLLKALDYPPFWRDRLRQLAFIVPGRIDLKRMLRHEILTVAEVEEGYNRLGYSPQDAQRMTAIAVAELDTGLGAQPWAQRARGRLYTVAHNEYLAGSIDEAAARDMLGRVGALAAETNTIVALWNAERTINRLELTPAQVKKAYKADEYDEATARAELIERGMTPSDADTFLRS